MKELKCHNCGSNDLAIQNNIATCQYCNTKFIIDVSLMNIKVENPLYVCLQCGEVGVSKKCIFCQTKMVKIQPEIDLTQLFHASDEEIESFALTVQPKDKFNQKAWQHRTHMQLGYKEKGWPRGFNYQYQEGISHPQCPHCGQYWTQKEKSLFKGEHWHCYFCDSDF